MVMLPDPGNCSASLNFQTYFFLHKIWGLGVWKTYVLWQRQWMFNDTSGHGICTNYVSLQCQKCTWEESLIQTFRTALCLQWRSVASSVAKKKWWAPQHKQILYFAQPRPAHSSSVCFYLQLKESYLQLPNHFFTSSEMFSFPHIEFVAGCLRHNSIFCLGCQTSGSQLSRQMTSIYSQSLHV